MHDAGVIWRAMWEADKEDSVPPIEPEWHDGKEVNDAQGQTR